MNRYRGYDMKWMSRQGDVLIVEVDELPEGLEVVPREDGRVILAYGEATGHHHAIADSDVDLLEGKDIDDRFLRVLSDSGVFLTHEEHDTHVIPPGNHRVIIQREYTPAGIKRVAD